MSAIEEDIRDVLVDILKTLEAMKKQEYEYWEAWKKAKQNES